MYWNKSSHNHLICCLSVRDAGSSGHFHVRDHIGMLCNGVCMYHCLSVKYSSRCPAPAGRRHSVSQAVQAHEMCKWVFNMPVVEMAEMMRLAARSEKVSLSMRILVVSIGTLEGDDSNDCPSGACHTHVALLHLREAVH